MPTILFEGFLKTLLEFKMYIMCDNLSLNKYIELKKNIFFNFYKKCYNFAFNYLLCLDLKSTWHFLILQLLFSVPLWRHKTIHLVMRWRLSQGQRGQRGQRGQDQNLCRNHSKVQTLNRWLNEWLDLNKKKYSKIFRIDRTNETVSKNVSH